MFTFWSLIPLCYHGPLCQEKRTQTNLHRKVFLDPIQTDYDTHITMCLRIYSRLTRKPADQRTDRSPRRRPFSTWVKKLTNFKASSSGEGAARPASKLNYSMRMHAKRRTGKKNNPYPESGYVGNGTSYPGPRHESVYSVSTGSGSETSLERHRSMTSSLEGLPPATSGARSVALTVSTDRETSRSIAAPSHGASSLTGTTRTVGGGRRGGDSTFSSPAASVRSLTTTLTTIQSAANGGNASNLHNTHHHSHNNTQTITFNQPFPTTSPASALPPHMAQNLAPHPTTYTMATANNLLTDNASILTLASSSKRRRRRSFDTDASVRALAPSSLWGGSRESLPLSVLSANIEASTMPPTPGLHQSGSRVTASAAERTSIYSAVGIGPALQSERNSIYARQSIVGDGASVRSGLISHGRAESISGSGSGSAGVASPPLASPREDAEQSGAAEKEGEKADALSVAGKGSAADPQ